VRFKLRALVRAARRSLAEYLRSLSEREAEFARLEAQQRRIQSEIDRFSAHDRLDREELHRRAVR
jgi:predicted  nucleic acid-binding Zn-ribbon protein